MGNRETAVAALRAAQAKVEALYRIPETEDYPEGTVIRWRQGGFVWRAAVKIDTTKHLWEYHSARYGWDTLVRFLAEADVVEVAVAWEDVRSDPATPPITVTRDEGGGYVLTDTRGGRRWVLNDDLDWVRLPDGG